MAATVVTPQDSYGGSYIVLRELTGPQRAIELDGRAGPFAGVEYSGTMRAQITHYPGNPTASMQVLGAMEDPTTMTGRWKRRFFGANEFDSGAEAVFRITDGSGTRTLLEVPDMVQAMDGIRRGGQMLEVVWAEVVRVGLLRKFSVKYQSRMEVEWTLEFEWVSQGDVTVETLRRQDNLSDVEQQLATAVGRLLEQMDVAPSPERVSGMTDIPASLPDGIVSLEPAGATQDLFREGASSMAPGGASLPQAIAAFIQDQTIGQEINKLIVGYAGVRNEVAAYVTAAADAGNATRGIIGRLFGIAHDAQHLWDVTQATVPEAWFGVVDAASLGVADVLAMTVFTRRAGARVREVRNFAYRKKDDLARVLEPDMHAIFIAQAGQNLREVSTKYYGTPDGWRFLRQYNNLESSELVAGQVIFVPRSPNFGDGTGAP